MKKHFDPEKFVKNKYNHLLSALILLFILSPWVETRDPREKFPFMALIVLAVLVTALRTGFPKGPFLYSFVGVAVVSFALNLLAYYLPDSQDPVSDVLIFVNRGISVIFYLITIYLLSKRLFRVHKVTADTIKGGVSAYLLIGFVWATLYGLLMQVDPSAFAFAAGKQMMFMHLSFTTLTTLGYGDIVPNNRFAAVLTSSEAVIGQLYLTIFVARLVGLYIVSETKEFAGSKTDISEDPK